MKPQDRLDAREGFENDKYNILVSTSVLEEGIDIQACNIVVRYMYIKDMIAKIQSKGMCMLDSNSAPWHFTPWATRMIIGVVIHMYKFYKAHPQMDKTSILFMRDESFGIQLISSIPGSP